MFSSNKNSIMNKLIPLQDTVFKAQKYVCVRVFGGAGESGSVLQLIIPMTVYRENTQVQHYIRLAIEVNQINTHLLDGKSRSTCQTLGPHCGLLSQWPGPSPRGRQLPLPLLYCRVFPAWLIGKPCKRAYSPFSPFFETFRLSLSGKLYSNEEAISPSPTLGVSALKMLMVGKFAVEQHREKKRAMGKGRDTRPQKTFTNTCTGSQIKTATN